MYNKKEQLIVMVLTLSLLSFYAVTPAIGASEHTKLKIIPASEVSSLIGVNKVKVLDGSDTTKLKSLEESANESKVYDRGSTSKFTDSSGKTNTYVTEEVKEEKEEDDESALSKLNPLNIGKKMVGEGGIYFLELLGDAGFKVGSKDADTVAVKENYGNAVAMIYTMATLEFDPSENTFVKDIQFRFAIIGFFLIVLFILLGAINVNIYAMTSANNVEKAYILSNRYHIPINEYALTLIEACVMMTAGYIILRLTIVMELMFTKLIMFQILDRILPTGSNIIMYLMMSICYLIIGFAIAYRIIIISIFHASYIAWIGLYCFGITRPAATAAWWYYLKILFMRTIIVGVTVIGVGVISYVHVHTGSLGEDALELVLVALIHPLLYSALVLILAIVCIMFIVGIRNVMSASKYAIRRYTYGALRP
ncbi:MAG: hypothetical protein M0P26_01085 [Bacteroidales bacterium]|nr:hypothetical protein [Bacteroidales bacterium]